MIIDGSKCYIPAARLSLLTLRTLGILTDLSVSRRTEEAGEAWKANPDVRLDADSIAKVRFMTAKNARSHPTSFADSRGPDQNLALLL